MAHERVVGGPRSPADWSQRPRPCLGRGAPIGAEMAGVDLIPDLDRGQLVVLEVNAVPGWRALARVAGVDIAVAVLGALRDSKR